MLVSNMVETTGTQLEQDPAIEIDELYQARVS